MTHTTVFLLVSPTPPNAPGGSGASFASTGGIAGTLPTGEIGSEAPRQELVLIRHWESNAPVLLKRIRDHVTGSLLDPNEVLSITLRVFDLDDPVAPETPDYEIELHWEEVLFTEPQLTSDWTVDAIGYNFRYQVWPFLIDKGEHIFRFEFVFHVLGIDAIVQEYDVVRAWHVRSRSKYGGQG